MTIPTPAAARPGRPRPLAVRAERARGAALLIILITLLAACGNQPATRSSGASGTFAASPPATGSVRASAAPSATPLPTALPTPQYTNPADAELSALIPEELAGVTIHVPPVEQFAITPGDVAEAYGDLGVRFTALQVAYVEEPRLSLYAMRVAAPAVRTEDLEPYLETAGRYVGIAGLVREPWELVEIGRRLAWVRPEDNATIAGTMVYTWAADDLVFLMIGVDDELNRALFRALPAEAAPTPTPRPSRSQRPSVSAQPSASAAAS